VRLNRILAASLIATVAALAARHALTVEDRFYVIEAEGNRVRAMDDEGNRVSLRLCRVEANPGDSVCLAVRPGLTCDADVVGCGDDQ